MIFNGLTCISLLGNTAVDRYEVKGDDHGSE